MNNEVSMKEIYKSNAKSFVFGVNNNYENYLLFIDRIHKAMIDKKNEHHFFFDMIRSKTARTNSRQ